MVIKEINNKEIWDGFLLEQVEKTFLQSWSWGEFNSQMGEKIWRFGAYNEDKLVGVVLVFKIIYFDVKFTQSFDSERTFS